MEFPFVKNSKRVEFSVGYFAFVDIKIGYKPEQMNRKNIAFPFMVGAFKWYISKVKLDGRQTSSPTIVNAHDHNKWETVSGSELQNVQAASMSFVECR